MNIAIAVGAILLLVVLHELGHFLLAKKFGVRVEEFGLGLPPRVAGKKIGETLYSLNMLPLGAFVRMTGEEQDSIDPKSFGMKPIWQRIAIVLGGVAAFWIISAALFGALGATRGIPMAVEDTAVAGISNPQVLVLSVSPDSPAGNAGIKPGDVLKMFAKAGDVQQFTEAHAGQKISLTIQRQDKVFQVVLVPRTQAPEGQGRLGVVLSRTAFVKYAWYEAPVKGAAVTGSLTWQVVQGFWMLAANLATGKGLPQGAELSGPIGIVNMLSQSVSIGVAPFVSFLATLSVYLAVFNVLPIPAADGGRLLFLAIEFFRKKPVAKELEQKIIVASFGAIVILFLFVTYKDIVRILL